MHPEELGISSDECYCNQLDQSTQTSPEQLSKPPSKSARLPLPRDLDKSDKGSITVFEYCHIAQNLEKPQDVTIIKETLTEEIKPHLPKYKGSNILIPSEEAIANRYKYCREVIKPYIKHPEDCPESEEELLKTELDSLSEGFPDYQPCFDHTKTEKDYFSNDIISGPSSSDRKSLTSNACRTDAGTSNRQVIMSENTETAKKICVTKSTENVTQPTEIAVPVCPKPIEECKEPERDPSPKPKCTRKKSTDKTHKKCSPKSSKTCAIESGIGIKCTSPSYYLIERCKDRKSIPNIPKPESDCRFINSHKKTISTIKLAMEDFVGKMYKSTKDAVSLITTESINKIKSPTSNTEDTKKCDNPKDLPGFSLFRKVDGSDLRKDSKLELPKISNIISNIILKVDSTLSMLSDRMSYDNIPDKFKRSFNDSSSEYDKPSISKELSNSNAPTQVSVSNGIFVAIKEKIVSMFYEGPTQSITRSSNATSASRITKCEENDNRDTDKVID